MNGYATLGRTGLRVSPLALGAMTFDDGSWGSARQESFAILDRYLQEGGNFIDTANQYNGGASEATLGAYFAQRPGVRDRIVLGTKFGATLQPNDPNAGGAGRKAILAQLEASLHRLNTDYVDVYWMHQWDRHTPMEETLSTLNDLVHAGKIRGIGLSNTPAWWVAHAATTATLRGWQAIAALQVEYSLLARTVEGEQFGAARAFGLGVTSWSPLASGVLSGKYSRATGTNTDSKRAGYAAPLLTESTYVLLDELERIAKDLHTTIAGAALAWVRQQQPVTSVLVGARTLAQLADNLASAEVSLDSSHMAELDVLTAPSLNYPHPFMDQVGIGFQQGDTTINGLAAAAFRRR
ncbi:aldo/keto reductase [Nonomuraea endophytica]|uniref:aldo/keto reductase n=1 Tax=Nonomuraea endophytica TaxID=714136 RepID=UPI0037CA3633